MGRAASLEVTGVGVAVEQEEQEEQVEKQEEPDLPPSYSELDLAFPPPSYGAVDLKAGGGGL